MSPLRNGLAMCGDYLSAATLLGSTGIVALTGYDGLLYLGGTVVAWMMALLLIAEPLRNSGKFTLGDNLALRLPQRQRSVRLAPALCTLAVCLPYPVAQLVGSTALLAQFIGAPSGPARAMCVVVIGTIVVVYAAIGGMPCVESPRHARSERGPPAERRRAYRSPAACHQPGGEGPSTTAVG